AHFTAADPIALDEQARAAGAHAARGRTGYVQETAMGGASTEFIGLRQPSAWAFEDLTTLRIFVRTVEIGNFSEVARRIGANPAMVSKRIANLENKIGQRLLNRNTRRLMVTEAGQRL